MNHKGSEAARSSLTRTSGIALGSAVAALVVIAFLAGRMYFDGPGRMVEDAAITPSPAIGGPFTLVDQNGVAVSDTDFRGRFMLVFFGYTYCPDICPTGLGRNSDALDLLGKAADRVVPIFVTVDPERDTVEQIRSYADFFHPRLVALTGTPEQIAAVAKSYRVYYAKAMEEGRAPEDYLIDHSSITYVMGPDGRFLGHFGHDVSPERMAERLARIIAEAGA